MAGIDYSMTCPSVTISKFTPEFSYKNCTQYFLTDNKKFQKCWDNQIFGNKMPNDYSCAEERFDNLSNFFIGIMKGYNVTDVAIEDYSMGSRGRVFHIAENTGILKHKVWKSFGISIKYYAPTHIKMFACGKGKGNANKDVMYNQFQTETLVDLREKLAYTSETIGSPIADLVDSYFVCKRLHNELLSTDTE